MASIKCWICDSNCSSEDNFCRKCGTELPYEVGGEPKPGRPPLDRRAIVGLFLVAFGSITAAMSLLIGVTPTIALGLASLLIGVMTVYLPEPTGRIAERLAVYSSTAGLLNLENLLDDLALKEKGIYIPAVGLGVCPKLFLPLARTAVTKKPARDLNNSRKVFITSDDETGEAGLLLEVPGKSLLSGLELSLKQDFAKLDFDKLSEKLESGLRLLEVSEAIVLKREDERTLKVQAELAALADSELRLSRLVPHVADQIGTPVLSAIAAAASKALGEYVSLRQVSFSVPEKKITATLELIL